MCNPSWRLRCQATVPSGKSAGQHNTVVKWPQITHVYVHIKYVVLILLHSVCWRWTRWKLFTQLNCESLKILTPLKTVWSCQSFTRCLHLKHRLRTSCFSERGWPNCAWNSTHFEVLLLEDAWLWWATWCGRNCWGYKNSSQDPDNTVLPLRKTLHRVPRLSQCVIMMGIDLCSLSPLPYKRTQHNQLIIITIWCSQ